MTYQRVSSSSVAEVGYDPTEKTLAIRFHSGAEYRYAHVSREIYQALVAASSIGRYFNVEIRGAYEYQRVT